MPFTLIRGTFHVEGYSPDGDSIRFMPERPQLLATLAGSPAKLNKQGHTQLRIEAVDALETHYAPAGAGGSLHQPLQLAHAAADRLLDFLGISEVVWDARHEVVISARDGVAGYILSRSVEKNGRPVAFVFASEPVEVDGAPVNLDTARLRNSYNYVAVDEGLTFPTYYEGLFAELRQTLSAAAASARAAARGLFAQDKTNVGFEARDLGAITDQHIIMPKLFRRLSEYMVHTGSAAGFKEQLERAREPVFDLREANFTHFDTFVEQEPGSDRLRLTRLPEELVFDAMPNQVINPFAALLMAEALSPTAGEPVIAAPPPEIMIALRSGLVAEAMDAPGTTDTTPTPINAVVDLSHHNASVNFATAKAGGLLGVIHKATQGTTFVDPTYTSRRSLATSAGLLWGAYHFGTGGDPVKQADHFLGLVAPQSTDLLVLDFEQNPSGASMTLAEARTFIEHIEKKTGRLPALYAGAYLKQLLGNQPDPVLRRCTLWIAQYTAAPQLPAGWQDWTMWQYTDGKNGPKPHEAPGIGPCDRDLFNGDTEALRAFWGVTNAWL